MMQAGKLRHRVSVESATRAPDSTGEAIQTWSLVADRWADIQPMAGREVTVGDQQQPQITHKVFMRFLESVKANDRLIYEGRVFNISAVFNTGERDRETVLHCIDAGTP